MPSAQRWQTEMMLPWPDMLRAALSAGITPDGFWRLSLREWRWLARSPQAQLGRKQFEALMDRIEAGEAQSRGAENG